MEERETTCWEGAIMGGRRRNLGEGGVMGWGREYEDGRAMVVREDRRGFSIALHLSRLVTRPLLTTPPHPSPPS